MELVVSRNSESREVSGRFAFSVVDVDEAYTAKMDEAEKASFIELYSPDFLDLPISERYFVLGRLAKRVEDGQKAANVHLKTGVATPK